MSDSTPQHSGGASRALLRALRQLLSPLVRLLVENQVTYPILASLLKSIYVEEANRHLSIPGKAQTISRLSLLTGIHRKDVKRIQSVTESDEDAVSDGSSSHVSLGAQLVLLWTAEPDYQDAQGEPLALPRLPRDRGGPSFESLVESVSKDIRPRAILDEWLRLGIVSLDAEDRVRLTRSAFVPEEGFDEKAYFLGRNVRDHIASAGHNLSARGRPMLERNVYYARLRPESIDELEDLAETEGMKSLQRLNQRARALQRSDEDKPDASQRMSFGVYFHRASLEVDSDGLEPSTTQGTDLDVRKGRRAGAKKGRARHGD